MEGTRRIDYGLPRWARRSNPIVKHQLGLYWKTLPLEIELWARMLAFQAGLVLMAVPFPLLYSFVMPVVTVSFILMPVAFYLYAQVLFNIARKTATVIYHERRHRTLTLLLVTPLPLHEVLFSKIAAAIWRNLDNLSLVFVAHVLLSLPLLVLQYANLFPPDTPHAGTGFTALAIILALLANMARLFIEPALVGAIGLLTGSLTAPRIAAEIAAVALSGFYFAFVNLPRWLPLNPAGRMLVDFVLPVLLPLALLAGVLALTGHVLRRD